jgi:hypothetical protein
MTTNIASFICSYSCRYSAYSGSGTFTVIANSAEEAKKLARQHLIENGGLEGIDYSIRKA